MSCTEMVCFKKDGTAEYFADIRNAFRGAHAIWTILEEKYLPAFRPSYVPAYIQDDEIESFLTYKPTRLAPLLNQEEHLKNMREIWGLFDGDKLSLTDKIVLGTTFDKALVKREDFPKLIEAFRAFEGETSLREQATVLEEMLKDEDIIAVGWNQTSVCQNQWVSHLYNEETDKCTPYNCLTGNYHFWIFDKVDYYGKDKE